VGFDLCDVLGGTIAQRVKGVKATVDGNRAAKVRLRQSRAGGGSVVRSLRGQAGLRKDFRAGGGCGIIAPHATGKLAT